MDNNKKKYGQLVTYGGGVLSWQTAMAMFVCALVDGKKIPDFPL